MYASSGKFVIQEGKRDAFVQILVQAAELVGQLPGCQLYAVNVDLADQVTVYVLEIWDDKEVHDVSLQDTRVRELIMGALPLLAGPPDVAELKVVGGHGLPAER